MVQGLCEDPQKKGEQGEMACAGWYLQGPKTCTLRIELTGVSNGEFPTERLVAIDTFCDYSSLQGACEEERAGVRQRVRRRIPQKH